MCLNTVWLDSQYSIPNNFGFTANITSLIHLASQPLMKIKHGCPARQSEYSILLCMLMLDWLDSHVECVASQPSINDWLFSQN